MSQNAAAMQILETLLSFDTTPGRTQDPLLDYVEQLITDQGGVAKRIRHADGKRSAFLGRIGPAVEGGIVLCGHMDVVSVEGQNWSNDPFRLTDGGDKWIGRGTCDMKGFNACALSFLPLLAAQSRSTPVSFAFTTDEETDNETVHDLLRLLQDEPKPSAIIVGEPTEMKIVVAHKGTKCFFIDVHGKAAHSSRPDLGISAIDIATDILNRYRALGVALKNGHRDDRFNPPTAIVNAGRIQGGVATNIIPEHCRIELQMRQILNQQAEDAEAELRACIEKEILPAYPGASVDIRSTILCALEAHEGCAATQLAMNAAEDKTACTAPYATEAGFLQQAGYDVIVCGPGSIEQAHKPDEFVTKDQIESCLRFLDHFSIT